MFRRKLLLAALTFTAAACGSESLTTTAETTAALETAQCDLGAFEEAAAACRATYDACTAADGADLDACRSALHDCLPPPPDHRDHGPGDLDGGCRPPPPPGADGGLPPPPRDGHDGPPPGAEGGRPPRGAPIVQPDAAAIQACRDALDACLAADATDVTCRQTEHECVRAAFDAAFQAACDTAEADCANDTSTECTQLLDVCAQGVAGGTCNAVN
jgi:hypothetical protein